MLIYEKNNKLNINFDNEISENPDLQIGKDGDKTEVLVDGSSNPAIPVPVLPEDVGKTIVVNEDGSYALANAGGGGSEPFIMHFTGSGTGTVTPTETIEELVAAFNSGRLCMALFGDTCYYLSNGSSSSPSFFTAPTGLVKRISYDGRAQKWTAT